jgi:translation initiation factor IF-3
MATPEALRIARERGFDLVLVSPAAQPPVCRIADYGKLKYELNKREKDMRKGQRAGAVKEIKISPKIAEHDFRVRAAKVRECLEKKHKVKVSMFFRGRENIHADIGRAVMRKMIEAVADFGKPEEEPKKIGKNLFVLLVPK